MFICHAITVMTYVDISFDFGMKGKKKKKFGYFRKRCQISQNSTRSYGFCFEREAIYLVYDKTTLYKTVSRNLKINYPRVP